MENHHFSFVTKHLPKLLCKLTLFCSMLLFTSCDAIVNWFHHDGIDSPQCYYHSLRVGFVDSLGNDLLRDVPKRDWDPKNEPVEKARTCVVERKYFKIYSKLSDNKPYDDMLNELYGNKINGIWYLAYPIFSDSKRNDVEAITYEIVSDYLFGNYQPHVMTAYWTFPFAGTADERTGRCVKIEFQGQDLHRHSFLEGRRVEQRNPCADEQMNGSDRKPVLNSEPWPRAMLI